MGLVECIRQAQAPEGRERPRPRRPVRGALPLQEQPAAARLPRRGGLVRQAPPRGDRAAGAAGLRRHHDAVRLHRQLHGVRGADRGDQRGAVPRPPDEPRGAPERDRRARSPSAAPRSPRASCLRLLNDVGDDPDQLPILQHALMRTWDYWETHHADGEPIDLRHYEAIGTMTEALSRHAEEAFLELETPEQADDRRADVQGAHGPGLGRQGRAGTRDASTRSAPLAGASEAEAVAVVDVFRQAGPELPDAAGGARRSKPTSIIDISHESLMRIWNRLIQWVDEEARSAQVYLRISKSALRFQEGKVGLAARPGAPAGPELARGDAAERRLGGTLRPGVRAGDALPRPEPAAARPRHRREGAPAKAAARSGRAASRSFSAPRPSSPSPSVSTP